MMKQQTIGTVALPIMRPVTTQLPLYIQDATYVPMGHTAYNHVGDISDTVWSLTSTAAIGLAAFHGYKRNRSVGWAIGWAVAAAFAPIVTTAVAFAQGVGKRKGAE